MASNEKDETPVLPDECLSSGTKVFTSRNRSVSFATPMNRMDNYEDETVLVGYTGPLRNKTRTPFVHMSGPLFTNPKLTSRLGMDQKAREPKIERFTSFGVDQTDYSDEEYVSRNDHLMRSGQLGMCNDPYCTTCPSYYNTKAARNKSSRVSSLFDSKFHNVLYDDAKGWARRFLLSLRRCIPGIMNPHATAIRNWSKFFVLSCLMAIFVDPLFFFVLSTQPEKKCIIINWPMTKLFVILRSINDFIFFLNMLLQFRLAYVSPESRVVGAGELVDHPKKIAINYFCGKLFLDIFIVFPLPQVLILTVIPEHLGSSGANYAKNLLRLAVLLQYLPRFYRFMPLIAGESPSNGFIFESAWANFVINILTFMLAGHVVGSMWYLFGLQRVNECLKDACRSFPFTNCAQLIDCGRGDKLDNFLDRVSWNKNENASACFQEEGFRYGIYLKAVNLTAIDNIVTRYIYSLFWGFQQISTLAGNQVPSYFVWEVLFTMGIIGLGLLLFALLIGNIQNFLQSLGRRRLEMSLRRRDVEQWMSHRRLPEDLRGRVREAERFSWAATRGVNEQTLFENLPEDLQIDIRRHLFNFIKKVRIFSLMDESILDAICGRLRQGTYIRGSRVLVRGGRIEKMVFIVRGKMESIGEDGTILPLSEGYVCGEELLTWCLEHSTVSKDRVKIKLSGKRPISNRLVTCVTNVEAFSLSVADIEDVTSLFSRFLRNPRVQGAIRYESPYWRLLAAMRIQVAWRYWKKRVGRTSSSQACSNC